VLFESLYSLDFRSAGTVSPLGPAYLLGFPPARSFYRSGPANPGVGELQDLGAPSIFTRRSPALDLLLLDDCNQTGEILSVAKSLYRKVTAFSRDVLTNKPVRFGFLTLQS
jgi:hypothetical protein